jgi:hypothetical protein
MNPSSTCAMLRVKKGNKPFTNCSRQLLLRRYLKDSYAGNTCLLRRDFYSYWGKTNFLVNR